MYRLPPVAPKASASCHPRAVTRRKEAEPNADIKEILHRNLGLDGPVMLEGLERVHDMITWRLKSSAREIRVIAREREVGKAELITLEKEITCLERAEHKK